METTQVKSGPFYYDLETDEWYRPFLEDDRARLPETMPPAPLVMVYRAYKDSEEEEYTRGCNGERIPLAPLKLVKTPEPELPGIEATLEEREAIHGSFSRRARMAMALKRATVNGDVQDMDDDERHAVDMICEKISRICSGNPHFADTWRDIAGYAMLVCRRLEQPMDRSETV